MHLVCNLTGIVLSNYLPTFFQQVYGDGYALSGQLCAIYNLAAAAVSIFQGKAGHPYPNANTLDPDILETHTAHSMGFRVRVRVRNILEQPILSPHLNLAWMLFSS